jgi:hypothetical protein
MFLMPEMICTLKSSGENVDKKKNGSVYPS